MSIPELTALQYHTLYPLCQKPAEKINPLLFGVIHSFLAFLGAPIASQSKTMNLIIIDPQLVRHISLLSHQILNLAHVVFVEQTIFLTHSQAKRFGDWLEISWNRY